MDRGRRPFEASLRKIQKLSESRVPVFVIVPQYPHIDRLWAGLDFVGGRIWY